MSIAVDQTRLGRIVERLLPSATLSLAEAEAMIDFVQLAAGADRRNEPIEYGTLEAIAHKIATLAGLEHEEVTPIPPLDEETRWHRLRALGSLCTTQGVRELSYAFAFVVTISDLELAPRERAVLEDLQHALGIDDRRATDLVVFLADCVAA